MDKVQMKPPLCKSVDSCVSFIQFSHESQIKQTLMSQKTVQNREEVGKKELAKCTEGFTR